ncbi:GDSL-type esterase/lipase family protein [Paenibacillus sp. JX-17]|uniref:GDSL-type esterase/lipase family protein n=1 Tax=Paenibacillus lacisoli TaxID=3064525 RepID=A0ABT9CAE5_9BACL|nr:GDSL-type esterase/lipase family protein [Paenibacillus sp. JX-17]MDO7904992.1 GDSL-type esterase/lipase family protein [Paenibacillus sp. JX-17]
MNQSSKWIWRVVGLGSLAATVLLLAGFVVGVKDIVSPKAGSGLSSQEPALQGDQQTDGQETAAAAKKLEIAAIGDSLARGTGDDSGSGFVRRSITVLDKSGRDVELLNNLAINGLTTEGLLQRLNDPGVQYVLKKSNLILLSIGGNDLFQGAQAAQSMSGTIPTIEQLKAALPEASKRLQTVLEKIREINKNATIVYVGLYNPFGDIPQLLGPGNEIVNTWNQAAISVAAKDKNMIVVPTFDLFQQNLAKYLSSDHFHPNGEGYQAIADRIVQGIPADNTKAEEGAQP